MIRFFQAVAIALLLASGVALADKQEVRKTISDEDMVEILKDGGFRAVEIFEERVITITIDGHRYFMYIYDDDDLQLYYGLTGYKVSIFDMNEWNQKNRISRAYIDDESDPVLESDLLANAGFTNKQVVEWVSVFSSIAGAFRQFLLDRDQVET